MEGGGVYGVEDTTHVVFWALDPPVTTHPCEGNKELSSRVPLGAPVQVEEVYKVRLPVEQLTDA